MVVAGRCWCGCAGGDEAVGRTGAREGAAGRPAERLRGILLITYLLIAGFGGGVFWWRLCSWWNVMGWGKREEERGGGGGKREYISSGPPTRPRRRVYRCSSALP